MTDTKRLLELIKSIRMRQGAARVGKIVRRAIKKMEKESSGTKRP